MRLYNYFLKFTLTKQLQVMFTHEILHMEIKYLHFSNKINLINFTNKIRNILSSMDFQALVSFIKFLVLP